LQLIVWRIEFDWDLLLLMLSWNNYASISCLTVVVVALPMMVRYYGRFGIVVLEQIARDLNTNEPEKELDLHLLVLRSTNS
jgi:hypothetical protein